MLPPDKLEYVNSEFWIPAVTVQHPIFIMFNHVRLTALNYFFVQVPPDQGGPEPTQIPDSDAIRRIREVHYDRGTLVTSTDIESKVMADCKKRYDTFSKSEFFKEKLIAYSFLNLTFTLLEITSFPVNCAVPSVAALFICSLKMNCHIYKIILIASSSRCYSAICTCQPHAHSH